MVELKAHDIALRHHGKDMLIVPQFHISQGEIVAIFAPSGAGKTLFTKAIMQLLPEDIVCQGNIIFSDRESTIDLKTTKEPWRGKSISLLPQTPMSAFNPVRRIKSQLEETINIYQGNLSQAEKENLWQHWLKIVGFGDALDLVNRYPNQLSGGQLQRLMLVQSVLNTPKILIADEPTSALDTANVAKLVEALLAYRKQEHAGILLITHDAALVRKIADRVYTIDNHTLIETDKVQLWQQEENYRHKIQELRREKPEVDKQTPILETKQLTIGYPQSNIWFTKKHKAVLEIINLQWFKGEILAIAGDSGTGKSTLVTTLMGQQKPMAGTINPSNDKPLQWVTTTKKPLQIVRQDPFAAFTPSQSIGEAISEVVKYHQQSSKQEAKATTLALLEAVHLPASLYHKWPHQCSIGQLQRAAIARVLATKAEAIIFDEALASLDIVNQYHLIKMLLDLKDQFGLSYLFVSHDVALARCLADRFFVLEGGEVKRVFD